MTVLQRAASGRGPGSASSYGAIVQRVISAAYGAFHDGLTSALLISAALILVAGGASALTVRGGMEL